MKHKAVDTITTYPNGVHPFNLVEGEEYELDPSTLAFLLERKLVKPLTPVVKKETKPASKVKRVSKETKVADEIKGNDTTSL